MKREFVITQDGSSSIYLPDLNESYHSKHGAVNEAYHVFIKNGLELINKSEVSILEIGFGTGLNALITYCEAQKSTKNIFYTGVEAYSITVADAKQLNYPSVLGIESQIFELMHQSPWGLTTVIRNFFNLEKLEMKFEDIESVNQYDLIYFDAFGYRVQPELWSTAIFQKMYNALKKGGVLTTYASRKCIKRSMQEVGFDVQIVSGPPGKREMTIARKL